VPRVRDLHPEFGYIGTPSFRRGFIAFVVCGLVAVASGITIFKADPDPMNAMALAPAEALSSRAHFTPAGIAESNSAKIEFAQRNPETGAIKPRCQKNVTEHIGGDCTADQTRRPRSIQAINERPAIAAIPIGHRDGPALLPSEPAIPVAATPDGPDGSAKPADAEPASDAAPAAAVVESPTPAASAKKARTRSSHVQRREWNAYSPSPSYSYHNYYQSGYARVW
jgi:hypothetical protein